MRSRVRFTSVDGTPRLRTTSRPVKLRPAAVSTLQEGSPNTFLIKCEDSLHVGVRQQPGPFSLIEYLATNPDFFTEFKLPLGTVMKKVTQVPGESGGEGSVRGMKSGVRVEEVEMTAPSRHHDLTLFRDLYSP